MGETGAMDRCNKGGARAGGMYGEVCLAWVDSDVFSYLGLVNLSSIPMAKAETTKVR